ncbi:MAG: shikimate dehydrogenase [Bacteroidales bacterium]|nr:shikimate dehydrogenase [Bacteroidales bacterium]
MKQYGLIGFPLSHSFSKKFFSAKFSRSGLSSCSYNNYELSAINQFTNLIQEVPELQGLNVTIPYKEEIIPFLDELSKDAAEIGAVNTIQFIAESRRLIGHNTDVVGFQSSLLDLIENERPKALILGTGGASKAVKFVLNKLSISYKLVSRLSSPDCDCISYNQLTIDDIKSSKLIINTSPVGMHPEIDGYPAIPYEGIDSGHFLFDLIYNPSETRFLKMGIERGANIINGQAMLEIQANAAWKIWNSK